MSLVTDNVDCEIRRLIIKNGRIPMTVEISRLDFADIFMQGFIDEIAPMAAASNPSYQYRGIKLEILPLMGTGVKQ